MQVNIVCKDAWQKITVDEWDVDPNDMKMTVKCLPTFKYDLPSENFPKVNENPPILNIVYIPIPPKNGWTFCQLHFSKCRSYCPAPGRIWNSTVMDGTIDLPLQVRSFSLLPLTTS